MQVLTQRRKDEKVRRNRTVGSSRLCAFALRGFSLIELMVVIVLIGIVSAMILPAMKGSYEDVVLRSTARKLVDALTLANSRAVSISQAHRVRLDRTSRHYVVERKAHDAQQ